jgi:hypothetical protein
LTNAKHPSRCSPRYNEKAREKENQLSLSFVFMNKGQIKDKASIFQKNKKEENPRKARQIKGFLWLRRWDQRARMGYLLFCGRTRKITQYAAARTADIDPDGARNFSN